MLYCSMPSLVRCPRAARPVALSGGWLLMTASTHDLRAATPAAGATHSAAMQCPPWPPTPGLCEKEVEPHAAPALRCGGKPYSSFSTTSYFRAVLPLVLPHFQRRAHAPLRAEQCDTLQSRWRAVAAEDASGCHSWVNILRTAAGGRKVVQNRRSNELCPLHYCIFTWQHRN